MRLSAAVCSFSLFRFALLLLSLLFFFSADDRPRGLEEGLKGGDYFELFYARSATMVHCVRERESECVCERERERERVREGEAQVSLRRASERVVWCQSQRKTV